MNIDVFQTQKIIWMDYSARSLQIKKSDALPEVINTNKIKTKSRKKTMYLYPVIMRAKPELGNQIA